MTYTLDFYYWTAGRRAGTPVPVRSEPDLDRVLAEILSHSQPHSTQIAARELPTFGPAEIPDRMFKIDVAPTGEHAALHYFGPTESLEADPEAGAALRAWVTCCPEDGSADMVPALYIDKANQTAFPRNAIIPMDLARLALLEFAETGVRPGSVQWQPCACT